MTTVKDIFDIAITHMDELGDDGSASNRNTRDYELRTPALVTALFPECFLRDSSYQSAIDAANHGGRYRVRPGSQVFTKMKDDVPLDDEIARTIMPYGLAAALLADENPTLAQFFQTRYEELLVLFETIGPRVHQPADWEPIGDYYGGFYDDPGAMW